MSAFVCGCDPEENDHHCAAYPECAFGRTHAGTPRAAKMHADIRALLEAIGDDNPAALALLEAWKLTHGDRKASYGQVELSFARYAKIFSGLLGKKLNTDLTAADVALLMIALKLGRQANKQSSDNVVDAFGYTILLAEISA